MRVISLLNLWIVCLGISIVYTAVLRSDDSRDDQYHPLHHGIIQSAAQTLQHDVNWHDRGQQDLVNMLNKTPKIKSAKNIVLFIGDGMGVSTVTAGRIFKAQTTGQPVADTDLSWEHFSSTGLIKTYNTDQQTADSAGTATAFLAGQKTRAGVLGLNQNVPRGACNMSIGNELTNLFDFAIDSGKWTGIVTTTGITHATPAAAYAHSPERDWEDDSEIPADVDQEMCWDIARQLVDGEKNKNIRVLLGGGRRHFMPNTTPDPEYPNKFGRRLDGRDLRQEWSDLHRNMLLEDGTYVYVENRTDFNNVDVSSVQYLMGLFGPSHLKFETDRMEETGDTWTEPSLAEMVKKSLDILKKGPDGYVLFAEAGRIDHGHHFTSARKALQDTLAMDEALRVVLDETSEDDTLVIVTSDHSHTFSIAGYPHIDNDILGVVVDPSGEMTLADDGKPYLTLGYANGQGFYAHRTTSNTVDTEIPRMNLTGIETNGSDFEQDAGVPMRQYETHAGEDVAVYARGPMSHLFVGQHEQSYIAHAVMYSACLGWNKELCTATPEPSPCGVGTGSSLVKGDSTVYLFLLVLVCLLSW